jgi:biotin-(acetyl-CoA carboxylase) ligase
LYSVTGKNYVVQDVVHELLFNLNFRLQQATQNQAIIEEMYNANLYLRNTLTAFEMREILVYGMPTKVDSLGNLHIAINGQIQKFAFGEIKQILPGTN